MHIESKKRIFIKLWLFMSISSCIFIIIKAFGEKTMNEPNWMIQIIISLIASAIFGGIAAFLLAQWRIEKKLRRILGLPESTTLQESAQSQNQSIFNKFIGTAVTQTNQRITVHGRFDRVDRQSAAIINRVHATGNEVAELAHQAAEARIAMHNAGSLGENLSSITAILNKTISDYADAQAQIISLTAKLSDMEVRCDRLQEENSELRHELEERTYEHQEPEREYGDFERQTKDYP